MFNDVHLKPVLQKVTVKVTKYITLNSADT